MDNSRQKRMTWIILGAAVAIVVAGVIFLSLTADPNAVAAVNDGYDSYRVSLADAKDAFDDESALFVDVRSPGEFNASRIPGAILIPLDQIAGNEPPVDKGTLIYTYCT